MKVTVRGREVPPTVFSLKGKKASLSFECSQIVYMLQAACCVPASIAIVIPQRQNLSGALLKPLRAWDYPRSLPLVPKRRCLLVYVLFCIITIAYANCIFRLAIYQEFFH